MPNDTFRGLARGLTADWLGAPVDLATQAANLGIAGTGYLAHKLRLINQPPDLIDPSTVPFSSDWHVKNSPLEDTGSAQYLAGRLTGNLAPGLRAFQTPKVKHGQTNALYPGGDDSLLLSHSTAPNDLIQNQPNEFYHLSSAITKDRIPDDFGPVSIILNPKKFEPKHSTSVITNRDAWTPRKDSSHAGGRYESATTESQRQYDEWKDLLKANKDWVSALKDLLSKDYLSPAEKAQTEQNLSEGLAYIARLEKMEPLTKEKDLQNEAVKRLSDRFLSYWPKGGRNAEGSSPTDRTFRDVNRGQGVVPNPDPIATDTHKVSIQQSPRFQSFKHYEKHPAGALTLTNKENLPEVTTSRVDDQIGELIRGLVTTEPGKTPTPWTNYGNSYKRFELIKRLANLSPKDIETAAAGEVLSVKNKSSFGHRPVTADELRNYVDTARRAMKDLREAPSNYAEVKTYGSTPINSETVAAIYVHPGQHKTTIEKLREYAYKKGVPLIEGKEGRAYSDFAKVVQEQNRVMQRRP